jgi:hypothetical protein
MQEARSDAVELNKKGQGLAIEGRLDEALATLIETIVLAPGYVNAYLNRAEVLQKLGRVGEARADRQTAFALTAASRRTSPASTRAVNTKGVKLAIEGKLDEALVALNEAIALAPDHASFYARRAQVLEKLGRAAEAQGDRQTASALAAAGCGAPMSPPTRAAPAGVSVDEAWGVRHLPGKATGEQMQKERTPTPSQGVGMILVFLGLFAIVQPLVPAVLLYGMFFELFGVELSDSILSLVVRSAGGALIGLGILSALRSTARHESSPGGNHLAEESVGDRRRLAEESAEDRRRLTEEWVGGWRRLRQKVEGRVDAEGQPSPLEPPGADEP